MTSDRPQHACKQKRGKFFDGIVAPRGECEAKRIGERRRRRERTYDESLRGVDGFDLHQLAVLALLDQPGERAPRGQRCDRSSMDPGRAAPLTRLAPVQESKLAAGSLALTVQSG